MDALSELTALSPSAMDKQNDAEQKRLEQQSESSQQCSADALAFAPFTPAKRIAKTMGSNETTSTTPKRIRLALELNAQGAQKTSEKNPMDKITLSQLSQSQQAHTSQMANDVVFSDTQDDGAMMESPKQPNDATISLPATHADRKKKLNSTVNPIERLQKPAAMIQSESSMIESSQCSEDLACLHLQPTKVADANDVPVETHADEALNVEETDAARKYSTDSSYPDTESLGDSEDEKEDMATTGHHPSGDDKSEMTDSDQMALRQVAQQWKKQSHAVAKPSTMNHSDDDEDMVPPTQPSKTTSPQKVSPAKYESQTTTSPSSTSPHRSALRKREKTASHALPTPSKDATKQYDYLDSSCKCGEMVCQCDVPPTTYSASAKSSPPPPVMRNLAFSFAMPDSQDSESQSFDSLPDIGMMASKALSAFPDTTDHALIAPKAAVSNVEKLKRPQLKQPSAQQKRETNVNKHEETAVRSSPLKKNDRIATPAHVSTPPTGRKRSAVELSKSEYAENQHRSPEKQMSPVKTVTPSNRKRKRAFLSPDAGVVSSTETPTRSTRSTRTTSETTPSVRTRPKMISPLPTPSRAYTSRTKALFKFKFEFCLTGFVGDGEASLIEAIEDHGGKICSQDVLVRNNSKAVVIATPVSWRKRKFMIAVACGIPVVHPEWIHACARASQIVPFDGYYIPSGYSVTTHKFECHPPKHLDIFAGYSFGIPFDVRSTSKTSVKDMAGLMRVILRSCGASGVIEDLTLSRTKQVDIVLSDDYTDVCDGYKRKHDVPIKNFAWVTECVILQRFLAPESVDFHPQKHLFDRSHGQSQRQSGRESVLATTADVGDPQSPTTLKLYTGELVLADLSGENLDHFLLYHVCEILGIYIVYDDETRSKRKLDDQKNNKQVVLQVGVLKRRSPYSPGLSRDHSRVLEIAASQVKCRVVAVAKKDFDAMAYRDETVFYFQDEGSAADEIEYAS